MRRLVQQPDLDGREVCRLAQERRQRLLAARLGEARRQIERAIRRGAGRCATPPCPRRRSPRAARPTARRPPPPSMPRRRHQRLAAHACAAERQRDALQRLALEAAAERLRPIDEEAAIGRPQRRYGDTLGGRATPPNRRSSRGAASWRRRAPARSRRRRRPRLPAGASNTNRPSVVPAAPAAARAERDAGMPRAAPARRAAAARPSSTLGNTRPLEPTKVGLAERFAPGAHRFRRQRLDGRPQLVPRPAVARQEARQLLAVGQVEAAAPGQQELPPERGHAVVDGDAWRRRRPAPRPPSVRRARRRPRRRCNSSYSSPVGSAEPSMVPRLAPRRRLYNAALAQPVNARNGSRRSRRRPATVIMFQFDR